jgi:hypothetical protein
VGSDDVGGNGERVGAVAPPAKLPLARASSSELGGARSPILSR